MNPKSILAINELTNINAPIKYKLADRMRNNMHIDDEYLVYLDVYRIVHWEIPKFKCTMIDGTITTEPWADNPVVFNCIYHQCTPALVKKAKEVRLSFRKAKPEFNIEPYVLVQIVIQD